MEYNKKEAYLNSTNHQRKLLRDTRKYYFGIKPKLNGLVSLEDISAFHVTPPLDTTLRRPRKYKPNEQNKFAEMLMNQKEITDFMKISYYLNGPFGNIRTLMREINIILKLINTENVQTRKNQRLRLKDIGIELASRRRTIRSKTGHYLKSTVAVAEIEKELNSIKSLFAEQDRITRSLEADTSSHERLSGAVRTGGFSTKSFETQIGLITPLVGSEFWRDRWMNTINANYSKFITADF